MSNRSFCLFNTSVFVESDINTNLCVTLQHKFDCYYECKLVFNEHSIVF